MNFDDMDMDELVDAWQEWNAELDNLIHGNSGASISDIMQFENDLRELKQHMQERGMYRWRSASRWAWYYEQNRIGEYE